MLDLLTVLSLRNHLKRAMKANQVVLLHIDGYNAVVCHVKSTGYFTFTVTVLDDDQETVLAEHTFAYKYLRGIDVNNVYAFKAKLVASMMTEGERYEENQTHSSMDDCDE